MPRVRPDPPEVARSWLLAAADAQISGELELVYEQTAREIDDRKPRCDTSGRCCNFEAWGHRLYVTGLEAAYLFARLDGFRETSLTPTDLTLARRRGGCPFQHALLCSVHPIRPLGCRTYFCDPNTQDWQQDLTERQLGAIRAIHDTHNLAYRYGEWRSMLEQLLASRTESPDSNAG